MKALLWSFLGLVTMAIPQMGSAVVNGTSEISEEEASFHAAVVKSIGPCSGVLIAQKIILTAAHCVYKEKLEDVRVHLGGGFIYDADDYRLSGLPVKAIHLHPKHDAVEISHDLAILELAEEAPKEFKPIPLMGETLLNQMIPVESFGFSMHTSMPEADLIDYLLEVKTPAPLTNYNFVTWEILLHKKLLFAADSAERKEEKLVDKVMLFQQTGGICSGDSGGGTVVTLSGEKVLYAINTSTIGAGVKDCKGEALVTRVGYHLDWIKEKVRAIAGEESKVVTYKNTLSYEDFPVNELNCMNVYFQFFKVMMAVHKKDPTFCTGKQLVTEFLQTAHQQVSISCDFEGAKFYGPFIKNTITKFAETCPQ